MFLHSEKVGQYLGWVGFIGEPVPHGHPGIPGQFFRLSLFKAAILDAVVHAAKDASGILHAFFVADMRAARANVGDVGPLIESGHLEPTTRSRRVLFKNERDFLAFQALHLCTGVSCCFQLTRQLQQKADLPWCKVIQLQKMPVPQIKGHGIPPNEPNRAGTSPAPTIHGRCRPPGTPC